VVPALWLANDNGVAITLADLIIAPPVPVIATGEPSTATPAVTVREALEATAAVGAYVTVIVQLPPFAARVAAAPMQVVALE
jgi:hypothetical protein